jgi:hypothetical protein
MNNPKYFYNNAGMAIAEDRGFISLKTESIEVLKHRKKLLQAELWRCRKVRPAEIKKGKRPAEQVEDLEKSVIRIKKALDRINAEMKSRKDQQSTTGK